MDVDTAKARIEKFYQQLISRKDHHQLMVALGRFFRSPKRPAITTDPFDEDPSKIDHQEMEDRLWTAYVEEMAGRKRRRRVAGTPGVEPGRKVG